VVLFLLALWPIEYLLWRVYLGLTGREPLALTANPIEFVTHYTGDWTLRFLLITLTVTPLRTLLNIPALTRFRRMLGLFAFFYGSLHMMTWLWWDRQFEISGMIEDVLERIYITAGMTGFLAMLPLAITSTAGWVRRLGFQRWKKLHRLIYLSAAAGAIHFFWLVKSDKREPMIYIEILAVLLAFRVFWWLKPRISRSAKPGVPAPPPTTGLS
jgi:sulfoxide reductase heme-binding subunit YedZ